MNNYYPITRLCKICNTSLEEIWKTFSCSLCGLTLYCSSNCKTQDESRHKRFCSEINSQSGDIVKTLTNLTVLRLFDLIGPKTNNTMTHCKLKKYLVDFSLSGVGTKTGAKKHDFFKQVMSDNASHIFEPPLKSRLHYLCFVSEIENVSPLYSVKLDHHLDLLSNKLTGSMLWRTGPTLSIPQKIFGFHVFYADRIVDGKNESCVPHYEIVFCEARMIRLQNDLTSGKCPSQENISDYDDGVVEICIREMIENDDIGHTEKICPELAYLVSGRWVGPEKSKVAKK